MAETRSRIHNAHELAAAPPRVTVRWREDVAQRSSRRDGVQV